MYACPFLFLLASSALQKALPGLRDLTNVVGYRLQQPPMAETPASIH